MKTRMKSKFLAVLTSAALTVGAMSGAVVAGANASNSEQKLYAPVHNATVAVEGNKYTFTPVEAGAGKLMSATLVSKVDIANLSYKIDNSQGVSGWVAVMLVNAEGEGVSLLYQSGQWALPHEVSGSNPVKHVGNLLIAEPTEGSLKKPAYNTWFKNADGTYGLKIGDAQKTPDEIAGDATLLGKDFSQVFKGDYDIATLFPDGEAYLKLTTTTVEADKSFSIEILSGIVTDANAPTVSDGTITASDITHQGCKLSWKAAQDDVTPAASIVYSPWYTKDAANAYNTVELVTGEGSTAATPVTGATEVEITGLEPNTTYYFNIVARDQAKNKVVYTKVEVKTTEVPTDKTAPVPGAEGNLTIKEAKETEATIEWTKATDNETAAADIQYKVVYSSSNNIASLADAKANGKAVGEFEKDIASKTITGLMGQTTYYATVIVKDAVGNEALYKTLEFKTAKAPAHWVPIGEGVKVTAKDNANIKIDVSGAKKEGTYGVYFTEPVDLNKVAYQLDYTDLLDIRMDWVIVSFTKEPTTEFVSDKTDNVGFGLLYRNFIEFDIMWQAIVLDGCRGGELNPLTIVQLPGESTSPLNVAIQNIGGKHWVASGNPLRTEWEDVEGIGYKDGKTIEEAIESLSAKAGKKQTFAEMFPDGKAYMTVWTANSADKPVDISFSLNNIKGLPAADNGGSTPSTGDTTPVVPAVVCMLAMGTFGLLIISKKKRAK